MNITYRLLTSAFFSVSFYYNLVSAMQEFECRNENPGCCSPGCLWRQHCLSSPRISGRQLSSQAGVGGRLRGTSVTHAFTLLANLCPPTPVRHQWKGSSVYFVEVLHPSLRFFVLAYPAWSRVLQKQKFSWSNIHCDSGEQMFQLKISECPKCFFLGLCFLNFSLSRWVYYLKTDKCDCPGKRK